MATAVKKQLTLLIALWCVVWVPASGAQGPAVASEEAVKAAFLYRFTGFIDWPPEKRADDGIVIGLYNAEGVESELRGYISRKKVSISVRRIDELDDDIEDVHILFIGARENPRLTKIIPALRGQSVLIVTEAPDGLARGSMINFVTTDRVRFEVAVDAAMDAGIRLNARLLSVAIRVIKGGMPGEEWFAAGECQRYIMAPRCLVPGPPGQERACSHRVPEATCRFPS